MCTPNSDFSGLLVLKPHDLLLTAVSFSEAGQVLSGYVVNGAWYYKATSVSMFAYREEHDFLNPVTVQPISKQSFVFIDKQHSYIDYNAAIAWAATQPDFLGDLKDFLDAYCIERINETKRRFISGFSDMDDDIPF
jgi:hypothetical protein